MKGLKAYSYHLTTFLVGILFSISAFSQNAIQKNIQKYTKAGVEFESYQPFDAQVSKGMAALDSRDLDETLLDGSILSLSDNLGKNMRSELSDFIELKLNPGEEELSLLLYRQTIFTPDARIVSSKNPDVDAPLPSASFFRGIVKGKESSLVALTVFENEISGMVSFDNQTYVLGKLKDSKSNEHIWYRDEDLLIDEDFSCEALPSEEHEHDYKGELQATQKTNNCVRLRLEIDDDIVNDFGSAVAATNYATSLFNQVITLFANDDIDVAVSEIFAWETSSPYSGGLSTRLNQLSNNSPNADLTQLLTGVDIGGIAYLSGLCSSNFGVSVSGIFGTFSTVPSYSWDVNVTTHEVGHNLSSPHTHACAWNGNNTAIDGCGPAAGFSEGCSASIPSNGGTIMSYCHLVSVGMNFNEGFGPQPTARMTNYINSRTCLEATCGSEPPAPCEFESLSLTVNTDQYPGETTWEVTNGSGAVVAAGGPYGSQFSTFVEEICLEEGCYTLTFFDSYGDGICCGFGTGSYTLSYDGQDLATGGEFTSSESSDFCVTPAGTACSTLNFNDYVLGSYTPARDVGNFEIQDGGATLFLEDNSLKFVPLGYDVTPNTILEFDFLSTDQGSLHGIGFDNNASLTLLGVFKVYGTLNNNQVKDDFDNYSGSGWQSYVIPVGQFFSLANLNLTLIAANANGSPGVNSYFRNIKLYEEGECISAIPQAQTVTSASGSMLFPNPTNGGAELMTTGDLKIETLTVFNMSGQLIEERLVNANRTEVNLTEYSPGLYLVQWTDNFGKTHRDKLVKTK